MASVPIERLKIVTKYLWGEYHKEFRKVAWLKKLLVSIKRHIAKKRGLLWEEKYLHPGYRVFIFYRYNQYMPKKSWYSASMNEYGAWIKVMSYFIERR